MAQPHKQKDCIIAWANGKDIEFEDGGKWLDCLHPDWYAEVEYRIKPEPKPDIVRPMYIYSINENFTTCWTTPNCNKPANVNVIFDGETGALKAVEVIK